ncbi:MAG: flagellar hook assembly protein FlgD [Pseudomonadota bacterium]
MTTAAIAAANAASGATRSPTQKASLAEQFDGFLTLLTTQLKNQDPLSPMEANEFTNQLVQFTGVEQSVKINDKLDSMLGLLAKDALGPGTAYLGKEIEALGDSVILGETGGATIGANLPEGVAAALVSVRDAEGETVRVLQAAPTAGEQSVYWDGLGVGGQRLPAGTYTVEVNAIGPSGNPLNATTSVTGTVTGVEHRHGSIVLSVGDREVALEDVHAVRVPETL